MLSWIKEMKRDDKMKQILKILLLASILFLIIGTAYAAHNNEIFKAPSGLQPMGYEDFVDQKGHNIMVMDYSDENVQTWFENDTDPEYLVQPYQQDGDMFYMGADDENDCYILEVVEKDGSKYIIGSWTPKGAMETETIFNNLLEFNKLNNLKPLEV